jgi:hypothetical protein
MVGRMANAAASMVERTHFNVRMANRQRWWTIESIMALPTRLELVFPP